MTIKTFKNPNLLLNKLGFVLLLLIASISTSCSHLFFEKIQPKGGELQNEFPSKIQGDYSKWCYTNSEGKDICINRDEIMTLDTLELKNLVTQDTNLRNALFIKFDAKTINFESLSTDLNGKYELNKDVFLSKIDSFYIINLKIDSKDYVQTNGKEIKKELFECFVFELDSLGYIQLYRITDDSPLKHKHSIIPVGGGKESYIAKDQITKKNIYKVLFSKPLPFIFINLESKEVSGPLLNEEAGVQCEQTKRQYKRDLRKF